MLNLDSFLKYIFINNDILPDMLIRMNKNITTLFIISVLYICSGSPLKASPGITVVGSYNNFPYEYLNNNGTVAGFTVELFQKIAESAGIEYTLLLLPPERVADIISIGEADIIIGGVADSSYKKYTFAGEALGVLFKFAANNDSCISGFKKLSGRRIAISGHEVFSVSLSDIIRKEYNAEIIYINNPETALLMLNSKGCDAVFMEEFRLRNILSKLNFLSIEELTVNPGKFSYGYFVKTGNEKLLTNFKSGLSTIKPGDIYNSIYSKWFTSGGEGKPEFDSKFIVIWSLVSILIFGSFIYINNHILKKRINEKTLSLNRIIAELGKTRSELVNSERKFRKIFDKSPAGILMLDSSGKAIHFNDSFKKIFGIIDPDEIYTLDLIENPNANEWFKSRVRKHRSLSFEFRYDFTIIRDTGFYKTFREGEIIIDAAIFPFALNNGNDDSGYIFYCIDVTQNMSLLHYSNETARRYEIIFDSIRDGLCEWRLNDDTIRLNRQFINILGFKKDSLPQTFADLSELIHPDDRNAVLTEIRERINSGRSFTAEYRIRRYDGSWLWLRSRGEIIEWDHDLSPVMLICTHTDITQLKEFEFMHRDIIAPERKNMNLNLDLNEINRHEDNLKKWKILIVDDNSLITLHLSDILSRLGCLCIRAQSGFEAVEIVKSDQEVSVVLLDIEMPELDGVTTMKLIKDIKKNIHVIANTGYSNISFTDNLIFSGFDDVLNKPVQENLLMKKIERFMI